MELVEEVPQKTKGERIRGYGHRARMSSQEMILPVLEPVYLVESGTTELMNEAISRRVADFITCLPPDTMVVAVLYGSLLHPKFDIKTSDIDIAFAILPKHGQTLDDIFTPEVVEQLSHRGWKHEQAGLKAFTPGGRRFTRDDFTGDPQERPVGSPMMEAWAHDYSHLLQLALEPGSSEVVSTDMKQKVFKAGEIARLIIGEGRCVYYSKEELFEGLKLIGMVNDKDKKYHLDEALFTMVQNELKR